MKRGIICLVLFLAVISLVFSVSADNYTNYTTPSNQTNYTTPPTNYTTPSNQTNYTTPPTNYTTPSNQTNYTIHISNFTNYTMPISNVSNFTISVGNNSDINISITSNASNFTSANISIEQALFNAKNIENVKGVVLDVESGKLVYLISGTTKGRLLAVVPITAEIKERVDANSGVVLSTEKPWWSFLATKI